MACYISSWLLSESCGLQSGLHDSREMTEGRKEGRKEELVVGTHCGGHIIPADGGYCEWPENC